VVLVTGIESITPGWAFVLGCAAVLFVMALAGGKRK